MTSASTGSIPSTTRLAAPRPWTVFLWTFVPLLILYAATRARTVTGEDSGELIAAAHSLGIAHPPGYPIWILVTHLFQTIFHADGPASAANLGSGILTAAAMGLMAVFAYRLTRSKVAAIAAGWLVGVGHEIWNHATIAEVYALNLLILSGCLLLFARWREQPTDRRLFSLALVYGCGLGNHPTFHWFLPVFAIFLVIAQPRILLSWKAILLALGGLALPHLAYLQVYFAALNDAWVTWGVEPDFRSIAGHYLREVYASGPPKTPWTLEKLSVQLAAFARFHVEELTLPGWILAYLGVGLVIRRHRLIGAFLAALVLLGSFGMLPVLTFDLEREELFTVRVFLMPVYLILGVGLAQVAATFLALLGERGRLAAAAGVLLLPLVLTAARYPDHDRSRYFWSEDYGRAILEKLPKDCILFPGGDTSTFPLIYLQACEKVRKDVLILDRTGEIERDEALAVIPEEFRKNYEDAPSRNLVDAVIYHARRPVVTLKRHQLPDETEVSFEPFGLGFLALKGRLSRKQKDEIFQAHQELVLGFTFRNLEEQTVTDHTSDVIQSHLHQVRAAVFFQAGNPPKAMEEIEKAELAGQGIKETLNNLGALLAECGYSELAEERFRAALEIRADYPLARRNLVLTLRRHGKTRQALEEAMKGLAFDPRDRLLFEEGTEAAFELDDGQALRTLCDVRTRADPRDPAPHRKLARWALERERSPILAEAELEATLQKDPKDRGSKEKLAALRDRPYAPEPPEDAGRTKDPFAEVAGLLRLDLAHDATEPARRRRLGAVEGETAHEPFPGARELPALGSRIGGGDTPDPLRGLPIPTPGGEAHAR